MPTAQQDTNTATFQKWIRKPFDPKQNAFPFTYTPGLDGPPKTSTQFGVREPFGYVNDFTDQVEDEWNKQIAVDISKLRF